MRPRSAFSAIALAASAAFILSLDRAYGESSAPTEDPEETDRIATAAGAALAEQIRDIFEQNRDAVVRIESTDQHGRLAGTGFYADPSGTVFTHVGVIGDPSEITVFQGVRKFPARFLVSDPRTGIALLKVDANTPFLPMGDSARLDVATPVLAIGYPQARTAEPSLGLVAGFDIEYLNRLFRTTHVRLNLPVQRGMGGAPVVDLEGKVVGIIVAGIDGNSGCYMLPINAAEKVRLDYARFGELRPGFLGISVEAAKEPGGNTPSTARVADLAQDTPAAACGIQDGDYVIRVGEIAVNRPEDVLDASFFITAGDSATVTVWRDGEQLDFTIKSIQHPDLRFKPEPEALPAMGSVLAPGLED